ncbi:MAG: GNAT family N-acetyltransferase [Rhodospirillales bacterium]|nr:GNAT family N-acetyltransferase [Rhodospirillales bacterium]
MSRPPFVIVPAVPGDAAEVATLHVAATGKTRFDNPTALTEAELRSWFTHHLGSPAGAWWVARDDHRILGYMVVRDTTLDHLYVRPDVQHRGVGRALLDAAKRLSPRRLELFVGPRNVNAQRFYRRHGFRAAGESAGPPDVPLPGLRYVWHPPG